MPRHYIAIAGPYGCLPNHCQGHRSRGEAILSLIDLHDLPERGTKSIQLKVDGYTDLDLATQGNEYAEVTECTCDEPWVHSDTDTPKDWEEE